MLITPDNLDLAFKGFKSVFTDAHMQAPSQAEKIFMRVSSEGASETYGWVGTFASVREWVGARLIQGLTASKFTIVNRKFEATVGIPRDNISDDKLGLFKPVFQEMGQTAKRHPDELIFALLAAGFTTTCYDGQNFFDTDHPVTDADGEEIQISNMQAGSGPAWYLLDTSRAIRPMIWQEREGYDFTAMTDAANPQVFLYDEYLYGLRARVNAGFGLWQLAFGSKAELNDTNYAAARAAMMAFKSDGGRILGVTPTTLVVPPSLESKALALLNTEHKDGGGSNPWKGTADVLVTPYLA